MKVLSALFTAMVTACFIHSAVFAGSLDSAAAPGSTDSYTLEDIWNRLNNGTAGSQSTFAEPSSGPTAGTGHTLNEIMSIAPSADNTNGAGVADVLSGRTFWGLTGGAWGPQTGTYTCPATATGNAVAAEVLSGKTFSNSSSNGLTGSMANNGAVTITPGTAAQSIAAGYHNGSGSVAGDADLVTGNIRSGVNIFGVAGDSNVVNTSSGDAVAGDMVSGKKAWVDGAEITGSLATQTVSNTTVSQPAGNYAAFNLSTVDTDLATGNIKSGVSIFGVNGDSNVVNTSSGDAAAADIISGKKAWVDGAEITGSLAAQTVSNTTVSQPAGNYAAFNLSTVDTDLVTGNIKSGASIFGVNGKTEVVDTTEATSPAGAGDILSGKKAFVNGSAVTGNIVTQTLSDTNATVNAGYYSATTLNAVDTDLATGNIKAGVTVFGVNGKTEVVDTTEGTSPAGAGDILSGKKAFVNGSAVTGTVTAGSNVTGTAGSLSMTIPDGLYSGSKTATANDADLISTNIRSTVNIFGVTGDSNVVNTSSGDAAAGDIAGGKKAWVDGSEITGTASGGGSCGVPETGQTTQYDTNTPKADDGGADPPGDALPSARFTDNSNGTVTDNLTGLVWLKNANCANATRQWQTALTDVVSLNTNGNMNGNNCGDTSNSGSHQTDWRLPTLRELQSLINYKYQNPALSNTAGTAKWTADNPFNNVRSDLYWSSSTYAGFTTSAWYVSLYYGNVYYGGKTVPYYVWPVR